MKIGVLEIMPKGHYTLVDSITRIFASDKKNEIFILTHEEGKTILNPLLNELENVSILSSKGYGNLKILFDKITLLELDRIYIVTLEKYFSQIYNHNFKCPIYLFIHNIDSWFNVKINYRLYNFFKNFSLSTKVFYFFKTNFIYPIKRDKIISKVYKSRGKFIVLSKTLKKELQEFVNEDLIEVIPFSVYNESLKDNSPNNSALRICIPGSISLIRRDYISLFKNIEADIEFFKGKIEVDLLGRISQPEQGEKIIEYAEKLITKGIRIIYYRKNFVPLLEFDQQLTKADIILGNLHVVQNKFSIYGKTKETGAIFAMIRCGKPGLLPKEYSVIEELKSSSIIFENYEDLDGIIRDLIQNSRKIINLKEEALKNSQKFAPKTLLLEIIK